ncbi:MAG: hypothetical protein HC904_00075 [Blastochloris sp.]|nr:hypothetical protein [Blastochloris sp.]
MPIKKSSRHGKYLQNQNNEEAFMAGLTKVAYEMRQRYGAYLIPAPTERLIPGALLEVEWWLSDPRFKHVEGYAWEIADGVTEADCASALGAANALKLNVSDKSKFEITGGLPEYGLSITSALTSEFSFGIEITGITSRCFTKGFIHHEIHQALLNLRETDKNKWRWIDNDLLVLESFYATQFTAHFKHEGNLTARLALQNAGHTMDAGLNYNWLNDNTLSMTGVPKVPFAVRGIRI